MQEGQNYTSYTTNSHTIYTFVNISGKNLGIEYTVGISD